MNRWFGTKEDSDKQASDRNARAARRTIAAFPQVVLSSDEDEVFGECETSFHFNVDGQFDEDEDQPTVPQEPAASTSADNASAAAAMPSVPFDKEDKDNDVDSWKKEVKTKFDQHDVLYWFNTVESEMKKFGINKQWDKKNTIVPLLPQDIVEELKPFLRLSETEAGTSIYYDVKTELLSLFGPKDEDAFKKAKALKCTGRPSAFGKQLVHIICPGSKPFEGCHCARMVFGFWEDQMSPAIKSHLAGLTFTKDTYKEIFKKADEVWVANGGVINPPRPPAVVAAVAAPADQPSLAQAGDNPQVAAIRGRGRGRGRGANRGANRGSGRGGGSYNQNNQGQSQQTSSNNSNNKPHQKGPKHPDLPASAGWACAQHWKKGRQAPYCSDPLVCQWVRHVVPRDQSVN